MWHQTQPKWHGDFQKNFWWKSWNKDFVWTHQEGQVKLIVKNYENFKQQIARTFEITQTLYKTPPNSKNANPIPKFVISNVAYIQSEQFSTGHTLIKTSSWVDLRSQTGGCESTLFKGYEEKHSENLAWNVKFLGETGRMNRAEGENLLLAPDTLGLHWFPSLFHPKSFIFSTHFSS